MTNRTCYLKNTKKSSTKTMIHLKRVLSGSLSIRRCLMTRFRGDQMQLTIRAHTISGIS
ncbi:hypothetical protein OESDEN_24898 [Oesophagostomum dentatum]|uniref:Uncharacterized protein n=1 Tax=Oesophagostomum dentatum TaxID=61180 RepID=A0A0B1RV22_OESDE|nr:hypothetical protein OESDEN_24898 [Oesophagostomum dentatum]